VRRLLIWHEGWYEFRLEAVLLAHVPREARVRAGVARLLTQTAVKEPLSAPSKFDTVLTTQRETVILPESYSPHAETRTWLEAVRSLLVNLVGPVSNIVLTDAARSSAINLVELQSDQVATLLEAITAQIPVRHQAAFLAGVAQITVLVKGQR
jgi:hypothetical protein